MKFTILTTCALTPIISHNVLVIQKNEIKWERFQEMIKNQNYDFEYNQTDLAWKTVLDHKFIPRQGGIFIDPSYLQEFYEKIKTFIDRLNNICINFQDVLIINAQEDKLDEIFKIHRKNPIDFYGMNFLQMYKKTAILFPNLEKIWNMTQEIDRDLKAISENQFS